MGDIIGLICEVLTHHRFGPWVQLDEFYPDRRLGRLRFERAVCRWCHQGYIRPMPISVASTEETTMSPRHPPSVSQAGLRD